MVKIQTLIESRLRCFDMKTDHCMKLGLELKNYRLYDGMSFIIITELEYTFKFEVLCLGLPEALKDIIMTALF